MLTKLAPVITLALATLRIGASQVPLEAPLSSSDAFLAALHSTGGTPVAALSSLIVNSFTAQQREELVLNLLEQHDVVDVMRMTGHGEGLDEARLLEIDGQMQWMTEGDKLRLNKGGSSFIDVTDHLDLGKHNARRLMLKKTVGPLRVDDERKLAVKEMFPVLNTTLLKNDIAKLSSFWNRSYRSRWGLLSSNWIYDQVDSILKAYGNTTTITSTIKFHHDFPQNTIIARIESTDDSTNPEDRERIILSAHQDSLNYRLPFYRAPGADDDGSGSVTLLQVLRALAAHAFTPPPHLALEVHWYAGEEGGLLGSQAVAAAYERAHAAVRGVLHMDMTAYVRAGTTPIVAFFGKHTDADLTAFGQRVADEYLDVGWNMTDFWSDRAGSDHMSWTKAGYPSVFVAESLVENFAPNVHTVYDDMVNGGQYSFEHMLEFVKLGIAFVVELSASA